MPLRQDDAHIPRASRTNANSKLPGLRSIARLATEFVRLHGTWLSFMDLKRLIDGVLLQVNNAYAGFGLESAQRFCGIDDPLNVQGFPWDISRFRLAVRLARRLLDSSLPTLGHHGRAPGSRSNCIRYRQRFLVLRIALRRFSSGRIDRIGLLLGCSVELSNL